MAENALQPDLTLGWDPDKALDTISQYESRGQNVYQGAYSGQGINPSTGTHTAPSTAQGYFQITNSTWKGEAGAAGVDLGQYPTAMSAPYDVQRAVAKSLFAKSGFAPWAPHNPRLAQAVGWQGGGGAGPALATLPEVAALAGGPQPAAPAPAPSLPADLAAPTTAEPAPLGLALALAGGLAAGHKLSPVDYDPFKIWKAEQQPVGEVELPAAAGPAAIAAPALPTTAAIRVPSANAPSTASQYATMIGMRQFWQPQEAPGG